MDYSLRCVCVCVYLYIHSYMTWVGLALYMDIFTCLVMQTYRTFTHPYYMTCPRTFTRTCSVQTNRL